MEARLEVIQQLRDAKEVNINSMMIDTFLIRRRGEYDYDQSIEPFHKVKRMYALLGAYNESGGDLRFLFLFPNLRCLEVCYIDDATIVDLNCEEVKGKARHLRLEGIQNCPRLKTLMLSSVTSPVIMDGIEFCQQIKEITYQTYEYEGKPIDITPIVSLGSLKALKIDCMIPVDTRNLCLSGCTSLRELEIQPRSRSLKFLEGVELKVLTAPYGKLRTLKGLNTTRLQSLNVRRNCIRSLKTLRSAKRLVELHVDELSVEDKQELKKILSSVRKQKYGGDY